MNYDLGTVNWVATCIIKLHAAQFLSYSENVDSDDSKD